MSRFPFRIDQTLKWKSPYPIKEHHSRVICGDPAAVAIDKLDRFLKEKDLRRPIPLSDALDCLWHQIYGDHMTKYEIMSNSPEVFPEMLPDSLYQELVNNVFLKE